MLKTFIDNWKTRHQNGFNLVLHALGIPMTVLAVGILFTGAWLWALILFVAGYALQFIGHAHEKSEVGELLWVKKLLRKRQNG